MTRTTASPRTIDFDNAFVERVMTLWDAHCDTLTISLNLYGADKAHEKEPVVLRALIIGREQRRQKCAASG